MGRRIGRLLAAMAVLVGAHPASANCTIGKIVELPVIMNGERPEIHARINGADAVFLLDSGAFYSMISPGTAAEFKLPVEPVGGGFSMSGVGGDVDVGVTTVKSLTLAGTPLKNIQFIVGGSETGGAGVLGQNVLRIGDSEYDLANGRVILSRSTGCLNSSLAYWAGSRPVSILDLEPGSIGKPHIVATITVNNVKLRAMFDTGASESVLSLGAAARLGIKLDGPDIKPGGFSSGFGRRMVRAWIAPIADVKIGGEEVRHTHLQIGNIGDVADMLVGADFFLSHRVYVAINLHKMFFTYEGGPIFTAVPGKMRSVDAEGKPLQLPVASTDDPADAEGFARRGAARASRGDRPAALADFDRAMALAPKDPDYPFQRARLHAEAREPALALADLNRALALKPDHAEALLLRASLRLFEAYAGDRDDGGGDPGKAPPATIAPDHAGAVADLDAASRALAPASDLRLAVATFYQHADRFDEAIGQLDLWIANHPDDSKRPIALNARCWSRALANRELPKALSDCSAAVRAIPHKELALDSRGLVRLRMGDAAGALADYDAALAIDPKIAWSLYGRGLAKLRLGRKAEGEADIAAADRIAPRLRERARGYGIAP